MPIDDRRERRSRDRGEKSTPPGYRLFYIVAVALIVGAWIWAFNAYFKEYDETHPTIAWVMPWIRSDETSIPGVLLWDEELVKSPRAGKVSFPGGHGPMRVGKGHVIARIADGGKYFDVKAPVEGYFFAALDGREGKWRYSELWLDFLSTTVPEPAKLIADGTSVKKGDPIGKIAPQPQDLRFIGLADPTPEIISVASRSGMMVKMDNYDAPSRAALRVSDDRAGKIQFYVGMPWFPPTKMESRAYDLIVETGRSSGVVIAQSAVITRDGRQGALMIKGSDAVFVEVSGRPIDGGRFLVTEGLKLGDAVVVNAEETAEGRISLW